MDSRKTEPLQLRLSNLSQEDFMIVLKYYSIGFSNWTQETEVFNKECVRRGIVFKSGALLLGAKGYYI